MQTLFLFVVLFCSVLVSAQTNLISDPGFLSIAENQCQQGRDWSFRSDYIWNDTTSFTDAQCQVFLELPTEARSGLTKGNETNINHFIIPALPDVSNNFEAEFNNSAAVLDFNSPCRAAFWANFTVENNGATLDVSFLIWTTPLPEGTVQSYIDGSPAQNADTLQYLKAPNGLLTETETFPVVEDVVNQVRVDIIAPDVTGSFYDNAFSTSTDTVVANIPIPSFGADNAIPQTGTNKVWVPVTFSTVLADHGEYAIRFASAHSVIGGAWGVSDVQVTTTGGTPPIVNPFDMVIDNASQTVGGTLTVSKLPPPVGK